MHFPDDFFPGNHIHETAVISTGAQIGTGNIIGPYCYIGSEVTIGNNNHFFGYVSIGMTAEHRDYFNSPGEVVIGNSNVVREFVTINSSTKGVTKMGNGCTMLRGSHLSHDSVLEDRVTVSCNVLIGGESYIMEGANLGLGAVLHQYQVIGAYAMLGMGAVVPKKTDILPGQIYAGNPAKFLKRNEIGLERNKISAQLLAELTDKYWKLRRK